MAVKGALPDSGAPRERELEIGLIDSALEAAGRGSGSLILFEGAPGLGKSALFAEGVRRARRAGILTLTAECRELESNLPHGVSRQLFVPAVDALSAEERRDVFTGSAILARPLVEPGPIPEADDGDHDLTRLHGLYWLCANLAERAPLLLAVDDAHWSDPMSLRFLAYLLRRLEQLPVALLVTVRPHEQVPGGGLQLLKEHPDSHVHPLQALSLAACTGLIRDVLEPGASDELCRACCEVTEGNPFLLLHLLEAIRAEGEVAVAGMAERLSRRGGALAAVGARDRIEQVHADELALARAAAVLGSDASLERCTRLAGLLPEPAASALAVLITRNVCRAGGTIGFVHPLIGAAVLDTLQEEERKELHRRAARLLHDDGVPSDKVASYLLLCDPVLEPWAADVLHEAARRAFAAGASLVAGLYLLRALQEPLDRERRADTLIALARAEALAYDERALDHLREAADLLPEGPMRATVYRGIGRQLYALGHYEEAMEAFEGGMRVAGGSDPLLELELAIDAVGAGHEMTGMRTRAVEQLDSLVDRWLDAEPGIAESPAGRRLYTEIAVAHVRRGESRADALDALKKAIPDPAAAAAEYVAEDHILGLLQHCLTWVDEFKASEELTYAALAEARRRGSVTLFATAGCFGARGIFHQGRIPEAMSLAQQAIDAIPEGWGSALPLACTMAAYGHMERGELADAERVLEISFADERWEESAQYAFTVEARGRLASMWGNHEAAVEDLRLAGGLIAAGIGTDNPTIVAWRSRLARSLAAVGRWDEALDLAHEEVDAARRFGAPRALAAALRVLGQLKGDEGIQDIQSALALVAGSDARLEHANCLVALGRALRRKGDMKGARQALNDGLRRAVRSGSLLLENAARSELTAAGARPRRRAVTGVAALTPGERRVAAAAARGLTNREIAESLFVTVKAVEWHLSNAYRKLGIRSREQLRVAFEAEGER